MKATSLLAILVSSFAQLPLAAVEVPTIQEQIETANKRTIPATAKAIERVTGAKLSIEVDVKSFDEDEAVGESLYVICHRVISGFEEAGSTALCRSAIGKEVRKVVIAKLTDDHWDEVTLNEGTLTVRTTARENAILMLHALVQLVLGAAT